MRKVARQNEALISVSIFIFDTIYFILMRTTDGLTFISVFIGCSLADFFW
jgi:hypothetical protein